MTANMDVAANPGALARWLSARTHEAAGWRNGARSNIAPFYVRRAESFIRLHLGDDVSLEKLAEAAGVSPRTLHHGFRIHRKSSPMKFLKHEQLVLARNALTEARLNGQRVRDVARKCGYRNFSQFSRDYKSRYGESPTATIRRFPVSG